MSRRLLGCLVVLAAAGSAQAQFNPYNPYNNAPVYQGQWSGAMPGNGTYGSGAGSTGSIYPGFNPYQNNVPGGGFGSPYGGGGYGGYGGYGYPYYGPGAELFGWADVMRAYGQNINQYEQARLSREQALQAKVDTAKKKFDYMMYVRANTPTFTQEQARVASQVLRRIQTNSNPAEISNGTALNILLDDLSRHIGRRVSMEPIPLSEEVLKQVNVVKNAGNLGLLRDDGKFTWPVAFSDVLSVEERKKIELTAQTLVQKGLKDQLDANLVRELTNLLRSARETLTARVNEIPTSQYLEAKRFLNDFDDARVALERGEAANFAKFRTWVADGKPGRSVEELTKYMVANGLKFAPATSRDEGSFRAVYSALVAYDVAMNASAVVAEAKE